MMKIIIITIIIIIITGTFSAQKDKYIALKLDSGIIGSSITITRELLLLFEQSLYIALSWNHVLAASFYIHTAFSLSSSSQWSV